MHKHEMLLGFEYPTVLTGMLQHIDQGGSRVQLMHDQYF